MPKVCPECGRVFDSDVTQCATDGAWCFDADAGDLNLIGRTIDQRFHLERLLGVGGMGAVYRARQLSMDRHVAVKVLRGDQCSNLRAVQRFLQEAQVVSRLSNPHIVAIHDFGRMWGGRLYIVMELLRGRPLMRGRGCMHCKQTGYSGRTALFEVLEMNRNIRRMVLDGLNEDEIRRRALASGFLTLRKAGIRKILDGVTTIEEVRNATLGDSD